MRKLSWETSWEKYFQMCRKPVLKWKIQQKYQNKPENKPENVYKSKKKCPQAGTFPILVEVRGVEPLSEDLSTRISPSAAVVQVFPFLLPRRRGNRSGSFIDPASRKALAGSFPILNDARI